MYAKIFYTVNNWEKNSVLLVVEDSQSNNCSNDFDRIIKTIHSSYFSKKLTVWVEINRLCENIEIPKQGTPHVYCMR